MDTPRRARLGITAPGHRKWRIRLVVAPTLALLAVAGLPLIPGLNLVGPASASGYSDAVAADAPLAYWRMGDTTGANKPLVDSVSPGTFTSFWNGIYGGSAQQGQAGAITGDSDTATATTGAYAAPAHPDSLKLQQFSVETWLKVAPGTGGQRAILRFTSDTGYGLYLNEGRPMGMAVHKEPAPTFEKVPHYALSRMRVDDNAWHHVAFVKDANSLRLYVDGGLAGWASMGQPVNFSSPFDLIIGSSLSTGGGIFAFVGTLDEMALYPHALSQDQVQDHYTTAGYVLRPLGGDLSAAENPCVCTPGAPHVGPAQPSVLEPVNTATGNFWHTFDGIEIAGRGPSLGFKPTYSAQSASTDGPLGLGWTHSYNVSLSVGAAGVVTLRQENSSALTFTPAGNDYASPPRVTARLVHDGTGHKLIRNATQTLAFNAAGQLTSITDTNGYPTTLAYDGSGRLATVTDSEGRALTLGYVGSRIATVTDGAGPARVMSFDYDGSGHLSGFTDHNGGITTFTYGAADRMATMRMPGHHGDTTTSPAPVITNQYDGAGRVGAQSDELGRTTVFDYTSVPGTTRVTDPLGNVTAYTYQYGLLTALTKGSGTAAAATWTYQYDPGTLGVLSATDPLGRTITNTFDGEGNLLSTTDALGRISSAVYNALNLPISLTDAAGVTTTMAYDAAGNLTATGTPLVGAVPPANRTTTLRYHENGNPNNGEVTSMTDPDGKIWTFAYDNFGLLDSVTDPLGNESTSTFDSVGRMLSSTTARGNESGATAENFTTHYGFDPDGLVTSITDALNKVSLRSYDPNRNPETSTDAEGNETSYEYNAADELKVVHRPDATDRAYEYHPDGSLHRQIDADGQATVYQYDAQGRVTTVTDPVNRTTTYGYDPAGNVVTEADPGGTCPAWPITYPPTMAANAGCTVNRYNAADELVGIDYSDHATPDVTVTYDNLGRRASMTDATGVSTWTFDSLGRLKTSSNSGTGLPGGSQTTTYGYDLRGNTTRIRYPGLNMDLTRIFDNAGRLDEIRDWNNDLVGNFDYDADGNLKTSTLGNGVIDDAEYDNAGRLEAMGSTSGTDIVAAFDYTRDDNGQVESKTGAGSRHLGLDDHSFTYSALNQLQGLDSDPGAFDHDPADNLTERHRGRSLAHDVANQLESVSIDLPSTYWGGVIGDDVVPADYGGDGIADLGAFRQSEAIWYLKDSSGAESGTYWGTPADTAVPGDYDGDGIDDTAVFRPGTNVWYFKYSSNGAESGVYWGAAGDKAVPGDYDGDGRDDMATFRASQGAWYIKYSDDGAEFGAVWGQADDKPVPADYDGDGKADLAVFRPSAATWHIKYSSGIASSVTSWGAGGDIAVPADFDGDNKADLGVFRPSDGTWRIKYSSGIASSITQWGATGDIPTPGDHDGDAKADLVTFRPSSNIWYPKYSTDGSEAGIHWGAQGDVAVPGDYDGDGLVDLGVYRPAQGAWYFRYTDNAAEEAAPWGAPGDIAVPADYDGDARADLAVFRPSNSVWYIKSSDDGAESSTQLGAAGDIPVPADYDGDGKADVATFRPGTNIWYFKYSSGIPEAGIHWGSSGAIPVPGDYDGDAKADLATFVPSTAAWNFKLSSGTETSTSWGASGDIAVPADYDGDAKTDVAVYRPSTGAWNLRPGNGGPQSSVIWGGQTDDIAVPADYDGDTKADIAFYRAGQWHAKSSAAATFGHDSRGNRIRTTRADTATAWNYGYDQANRMTTAPGAGYTYRGDGLRMAKDAGIATTFAWDESGSMPMLLSETTSSGTTRYIYGPTGSPIARVDNNGTLFYHHDQLGSIRAITDETGDTVGTATYDPYGTRTHHSGVTTPFGFAGEYTDTETGFQYLRARYYDPATATFLTRDPLVAQTQEPYGYVGGNPLNYVDPLGLNKCEVGANPLRWAGNALDCGSDLAKSQHGQIVKEVANVSATLTGIAATVSLALAATPCSVLCAATAGGLERASATFDAVGAIVECADGGGFDRACLLHVAGVLVPGVSAQVLKELGADELLIRGIDHLFDLSSTSRAEASELC